MRKRRTAREIDAEAADWAARLDRGPLSAEDERRFQLWLSQDDRRLGAFGRIRGLSIFTEKARALGRGFDPATFGPATPDILPHGLARRSLLRVGGAVAATALVGSMVGWRLMSRGVLSTGKGETRVFALQDGSVVTLNTLSRIAVDFSEQTRGIRLIQGEVHFDVAKNPDRPFEVSVGETQVRVVGTSFTIRRIEATPVQVLVREGIVDVSSIEAPSKQPVRIFANMRATTPAGGGGIAAQEVAPTELRRALAWRDGRIELKGETLAQAVAEFARYSDTKIIIDATKPATLPFAERIRPPSEAWNRIRLQDYGL